MAFLESELRSSGHIQTQLWANMLMTSNPRSTWTIQACFNSIPLVTAVRPMHVSLPICYTAEVGSGGGGWCLAGCSEFMGCTAFITHWRHGAVCGYTCCTSTWARHTAPDLLDCCICRLSYSWTGHMDSFVGTRFIGRFFSHFIAERKKGDINAWVWREFLVYRLREAFK